MRCWRRSTTWRGSARAGLAAVVVGVAAGAALAADAGAATPASDEAAVRDAIVSVVQGRLGPSAEVTIDQLRVTTIGGEARHVVATIDPSARLGEPARVALRVLRGRGRAARIGAAECVIRARVPYYEVTAPIARGVVVESTAVQTTEGWLDGLPVRAPASDVVGAKALRDLAPGDIVLAHDVATPPAVRSGQTVLVRVTAGPVRITVDAVAAQDGRAGEEIRIVNPSSGRVLRGRVVGPGEVEVHHGS